MKTGMGKLIRPEDLTHEFVWKKKVVPIGRFDPSDYPTMMETSIFDISQHIFDQLEDSKMFKEKTLTKICNLQDADFNACIRKKNES